MTDFSHLYYNTQVNSLLVPAVRTAPANSASMDLQNFNDALVVFHVGASGDTWNGTNRVELQIQESDDNSTFTAAPDASLTNVVSGGVATGTVAILNANALGSLPYFTGYIGTKRYVRAVLNYVGTHATGTPMAVSGYLSEARQGKVNA